MHRGISVAFIPSNNIISYAHFRSPLLLSQQEVTHTTAVCKESDYVMIRRNRGS